jgi:hypothetical protein
MGICPNKTQVTLRTGSKRLISYQINCAANGSANNQSHNLLLRGEGASAQFATLLLLMSNMRPILYLSQFNNDLNDSAKMRFSANKKRLTFFCSA